MIKIPLGMEVGLGPGHFVLNGDPAPPTPKGAQSLPPVFGRYLLWPNGWMDQNATWYGGRSQPRPHCARRGPSPHPKKGIAPQFSTHVCCGQTGWINATWCEGIGLGSYHNVLHGNPAHPHVPSPEGAQPSSNFRTMSIEY